MSPSPARSTLITSAPNHARSCVQVGPDCTCVKSRMRTPSNALPITDPLCLFAIVPVPISGGKWCLSLFLLCGRIETRDAAALGAAALVDHRVDEGRPLAADRLFHRLAKLVRGGDVDTDAAERLHQLLVARVLDEHEGRRVGTAGGVLLVAAVDAVVVHDDD